MNGVQTRLKCKPNVKRCKRFVFAAHSPLLHPNTLKTKAIIHFQTDHILTRFVFPPLNEDWSVGTVVGYEYNKSGDVKTNTFTIAPYARYFFLNSDVVRLFADGGFGFSTSKTKGNDALNSWNIGIKPGIAIKLSDHFCLVAKYGFLGYSKKENHGYESENVGIDFDTDELNFGFHYIF